MPRAAATRRLCCACVAHGCTWLYGGGVPDAAARLHRLGRPALASTQDPARNSPESELQGCPAGPGPRLGWSAEKESSTGRVKPFEGKRHICRPARLHVGRPALASTQDPARNSPLQGPESELQGCPQCPAGPGPRLGWSAEKESSRL